MTFYRITGLAALLWLCGQAAAQTSDAGFAVIDVSVVPMDTERVLEHQDILVRDGEIEALGPSGTIELPAGMRRIDGAGRYLMPGLADLHVHLLNADQLTSYIAWGVTTVMHLGGSGLPGSEVRARRKMAAAGWLVAPRIYTTNRVLDGVPKLSSRSLQVADADAARAAVRELASGGFDFVKIYNNVSRPAFEAIVDEANEHGLAVIGHIPRSFDPLDALAGGQDAIAHTEELFFTYFEGPRDTRDMARDYRPDLSKLPQLIRVMLDNDVATMPDLSFTFTDLLMWDELDLLWNDPEMAYLHPDTRAMWHRSNINRRSELENFIVREEWKYDLLQTLTLEFEKAGILQVVGTDSALPGLFPGKAVHRELTELVKAGLSNFEALAVGTRNAGVFLSRYIDEDLRTGVIAPGHAADLVLLAGNPLQDVRNARKIVAVAYGGRLVDRGEIEVYRAEIRDRYRNMGEVTATVETALESEPFEVAIRPLVDTHAGDPGMLALIENRINAAGYAAADAGDPERARRILALNTRLFPDSANTWDSLAEITLHVGHRDEAIALYRRALAADPDFSHAREKIAELEAGD